MGTELCGLDSSPKLMPWGYLPKGREVNTILWFPSVSSWAFKKTLPADGAPMGCQAGWARAGPPRGFVPRQVCPWKPLGWELLCLSSASTHEISPLDWDYSHHPAALASPFPLQRKWVPTPGQLSCQAVSHKRMGGFGARAHSYLNAEANFIISCSESVGGWREEWPLPGGISSLQGTLQGFLSVGCRNLFDL